MLSKASIAAVALAASAPAYAWWRVACTDPLVTERLDPIVSPGVNPSQHCHTIHGASNFAANSTYQTLQASSCVSCEVAQDKSNYWFPKMYFVDPKTKEYTQVPDGGLLIYYQDRGNLAPVNGGPGLVAFPPGFKMLSGSVTRRSMDPAALTDQTQWGLGQRATFHSCIRTGSNPGYDSFSFPTTNCEGGLNSRIHMPACWDGVNLDSADHKSHVAYLSELDNGVCPSTHPVGFMKLLFEVTWDINSFAESGAWDPTAVAFPFVLATGDPTGYSWHGDFQNGWDSPLLQEAINDCNNYNDLTGQQGDTEACSHFTVLNATYANECKISPVVNENTAGPLTRLPGCNPIQAGPGNSTLYTAANCPSF